MARTAGGMSAVTGICAKSKLAEHRLSVLVLARELGNLAEASRQRGLDRTRFYELKRRSQTQGFEGLS